MDPLAVHQAVVGVRNDKAKPAPVEVVVAARETIRRQRLFVTVAVVVVVADGVVGLDAEVVVEVDVVPALGRRVGKVAHVDYEISLRLLGPAKYALKPFARIVREHARIVVDVGKRAELHLVRIRLGRQIPRKEGSHARTDKASAPRHHLLLSFLDDRADLVDGLEVFLLPFGESKEPRRRHEALEPFW